MQIIQAIGTAGVAQSFLLGLAAPSQSPLLDFFSPQRIAEEQEYFRQLEATPRTFIDAYTSSTTGESTAIRFDTLTGGTRETTLQEHMIGELRSWKLLSSNWDGENAAAPMPQSIDDAVAFARLLNADSMAEPMLHANGRVGLFWKDADLYADIEFLGSGRIAYYIECRGDKHKGAVNFDATEMPALLKVVLPA